MDWQSIQQTIQNCRHCEAESVAYLRVPCGEKRKPPRQPVRPVSLYFVSVAPPWGGAYFWDESNRDAVRAGLFTTLRASLTEEVSSCRQFLDMRFFLSPAVKCPSANDDRDHQPSRLAVRNCAKFYTRSCLLLTQSGFWHSAESLLRACARYSKLMMRAQK